MPPEVVKRAKQAVPATRMESMLVTVRPEYGSPARRREVQPLCEVHENSPLGPPLTVRFPYKVPFSSTPMSLDPANVPPPGAAVLYVALVPSQAIGLAVPFFKID